MYTKKQTENVRKDEMRKDRAEALSIHLACLCIRSIVRCVFWIVLVSASCVRHVSDVPLNLLFRSSSMRCSRRKITPPIDR